jgi:hypothetical protein
MTTARASALTRNPKTIARLTIKTSPIIKNIRFIKKLLRRKTLEA